MDIAEFEHIVEGVLRDLPPWVSAEMENVYVVVERRPSRQQDPHGSNLLGLYEGVALPDRGVDYFAVTPDRIVVFVEPHLALGLSPDDLRAEIRTTVLHEIGHHIGLSDARLHELGWA